LCCSGGHGPGGGRFIFQGCGAGREHRFLVELKREATNRGTLEETTETQIKIDTLLDGTVSLLRLEVPFPGEPTGFEGNPFNPHLGNIKVRVGYRPVLLGGFPLGSFLELTFPTASPESPGSGKYQLSPGVRTSVPIPFGRRSPESHKMSFEPLVKQVFSLAGDENRKDINYTQFELGLKDTRRQKYWPKSDAQTRGELGAECHPNPPPLETPWRGEGNSSYIFSFSPGGRGQTEGHS
jgi:hypothetical protein